MGETDIIIVVSEDNGVGVGGPRLGCAWSQHTHRAWSLRTAPSFVS